MLMPFVVAIVLFLSSLLVYGTAMHFIVPAEVRLIRSGSSDPEFWKTVAIVAIVTAIMATGHLVQIALWAAAFLLCAEVSSFETAFYLSAQSYSALGYGDAILSKRWRLLGPLEAIDGLQFFGLSTAALFAILSQLIAQCLHIETSYQSEAPGRRSPASAAGDA
jgi:hypothetical protein